MESATETRSITLKKHIINILLKTGPISLIYISNNLTFNLKRGLISKEGLDALSAHIIGRTIAELCTLFIPQLISQAPVRAANLFGATKVINQSNSLIDEDKDRVDNETYFQQIGDVIRQGYALSLSASVPVAVFLMSTRNSLISVFNSTDKANTLAAEYLFVYATTVPSEYINTLSEGFLSAVDQEKWLIPFRILSSAVDLGLSFWLIPKFGIKGAAYATLGKNSINLLALALLFKIYPPLKQFRILSFRWGSFRTMRKVLAESWPSSLYQLAESGLSYVMSIFMGRLGPNRLAIYQVPNALFEIPTALNFSLNEAANRIVAQHYGSGNYIEAKRAGNVSIAMNTFLYGSSSIAINLLYYELASLFMDKAEIDNNSTILRYSFALLCLVNLFKMLFDNGNKILSATNDTILSGFIWLISAFLVTVPLSAISTYLTDFDISGISGAVAIGALIAGGLTLSYWFKRSHNIVITENNYRSSNQVASSLVTKLGIFSCAKKNNVIIEEESNLFVDDQSLDSTTTTSSPLISAYSI